MDTHRNQPRARGIGAGSQGAGVRLSLVAVLILALEASAQVPWQPVAPGIDCFHRRTEVPQEIFALRIRLAEPTLTVKPALAGDVVFGDYSTRETVSQLVARKGGFAGINADYFGTDHNVEGWLYIDGERRYAPVVTERSCVNVSYRLAVNLGVISPDLNPEIQFYQCVGGGPKLLFAGSVNWQRSGELINGERFADGGAWDSRQPWTAIGVSQDETTMIWVVVDGRQPGYSVGVTPWEIGALLQELGAYEGMKCDGGGSSTMVLDGRLLNSPSDGTERRVGNALLVMSSAPPYTPTPLPSPTPTPIVAFGPDHLFRFSTAWFRAEGETGFLAQYDLDGDARVADEDLLLFVQAWNETEF